MKFSHMLSTLVVGAIFAFNIVQAMEYPERPEGQPMITYEERSSRRSSQPMTVQQIKAGKIKTGQAITHEDIEIAKTQQQIPEPEKKKKWYSWK